MLAGQDEQRVDERVGLDQRSIEIDAEGPRDWLEQCGLGGGAGGYVGHGVDSRGHRKYTVVLRKALAGVPMGKASGEGVRIGDWAGLRWITFFPRPRCS